MSFLDDIGFNKPTGGGGGGSGGSDDDVNRSNLTSGVTYTLSNSEFSDRDITYRDRTGALKYIEPGDPRYDKAREELTPALKSELAMRQDRHAEGLAEEGREQAMSAYADPLPQTDPETYDPYGESITKLGVQEQRAFERGDARAQQDYLNKESERLLGEVEAAEQELKLSVDAQERFEAGETDIETLKERGSLKRRQFELDRKERELEQARSGLMVEEYTMDPSRAKQTIGGYLSDLSENVIPKLEYEISTLESSLQEPSISMPEQAQAGRAGKEVRRRRRRDDLQERLQKKQDELSKAKADARKYRGQIESLPETVPLQDYEKEEISKLGPYEMRSDKVDIDEARYSPSIVGSPLRHRDEPLTDEEHRRMYPEAYQDAQISDEDDEVLKKSFGPSITGLDTGKRDAAASATDTGRPSIRSGTRH